MDHGRKIALKFRPVTANDEELILAWANDEEVRRNSFHSEVIDPKTHREWFEKKINDPLCKIFIVLQGENPVGQIRIEIENQEPHVDISVAKVNRGFGLGAEILQQIGPYLRSKGFDFSSLIGVVKTQNRASQRAFEKAGFCEVFKDAASVRYKKEFRPPSLVPTKL